MFSTTGYSDVEVNDLIGLHQNQYKRGEKCQKTLLIKQNTLTQSCIMYYTQSITDNGYEHIRRRCYNIIILCTTRVNNINQCARHQNRCSQFEQN